MSKKKTNLIAIPRLTIFSIFILSTIPIFIGRSRFNLYLDLDSLIPYLALSTLPSIILFTLTFRPKPYLNSAIILILISLLYAILESIGLLFAIPDTLRSSSEDETLASKLSIIGNSVISLVFIVPTAITYIAIHLFIRKTESTS